MSVESDPGLLWIFLTMLCDWSWKLASFPQPIRCKTKPGHDSLTGVFPHFRQFFAFYFEFSLASKLFLFSKQYSLSSRLTFTLEDEILVWGSPDESYQAVVSCDNTSLHSKRWSNNNPHCKVREREKGLSLSIKLITFTL